MSSAALPQPEQRLSRARGFLGSLFDYSFSSFITPRIIKILYVLATVAVGLWTLLEILFAFKISAALGILTLVIGAPITFVLSMIWVRVSLEVIIAFFNIHGDVESLSRRGDRPAEPTAAAVAAAPSPSASEPAQIAASPAAHFCANCGAENGPGKRFCTACGSGLE